VGLYERAQEVLARTNCYSTSIIKLIDHLDARISGRAFYLHAVLESIGKSDTAPMFPYQKYTASYRRALPLAADTGVLVFAA